MLDSFARLEQREKQLQNGDPSHAYRAVLDVLHLYCRQPIAMALRPLLLAALYGLAAATPSNQSNWRSKRLAGDDSWKTNIKNVVVLVEENRSFDTFCGGLNYSPDINGLLHNNYCNSLNISDSNEAADVCAGPLGWDITSDDPNHSISGVNMQGKPSAVCRTRQARERLGWCEE